MSFTLPPPNSKTADLINFSLATTEKRYLKPPFSKSLLTPFPRMGWKRLAEILGLRKTSREIGGKTVDNLLYMELD